MRLLADENFPAPVVAALRQRGIDVLYIAESAPGASDVQVLSLAIQDQRLP